MENADDDDNANEGWKSNTELLNLIELSINENPSMEVLKKKLTKWFKECFRITKEKSQNWKTNNNGMSTARRTRGGHIEEKVQQFNWWRKTLSIFFCFRFFFKEKNNKSKSKKLRTWRKGKLENTTNSYQNRSSLQTLSVKDVAMLKSNKWQLWEG